MSLFLQIDDFPLYAIDDVVHSAKRGAILTASDQWMAADVAARLNREQFGGLSFLGSWREQEAAIEASAIPPGSLVYGGR